MKPTPRTAELFLICLMTLPFLFLAIAWNKLPAQVPLHYGLNGQPDRYGPKETFTLVSGGMTLFLYGLLRVLPTIDPKQRLTPANYTRIRWTVVGFWSLLLLVITYALVTGLTGNSFQNLLLTAVFLMLAALGNVMNSIRPNFFVGIRTPWTLANDDNWRLTHRLAGRLWMAGGLVGAAGTFLVPMHLKMYWMLTITAVLVLVPVAYSFIIFRRMRVLLLVGLFATAMTTYAQTTEPVSFTTAEGLNLDGTLTIPAQSTRQPLAVMLLIAGSGPTDRDGNNPFPAGHPNSVQAGTYRMLADSLVRRGVAVLRYDKRGSGANLAEAAKKISNTTHRFDHYVADAVGFIRLLQADRRFSRVVVAGHSEGSLVGMLAARQTKADGLVSLAGAGQSITEVVKGQLAHGQSAQSRQVIDRMLDSLRAGQRVTNVPLPLLGMFGPVMQPGWMNWMRYDPATELKAYPGPVLIVQGRHDIQVAVTEAELLKAARPDARLILFDGMTHLLKDGPSDRAENMKTYARSDLPLTTGLAGALADFIRTAGRK